MPQLFSCLVQPRDYTSLFRVEVVAFTQLSELAQNKLFHSNFSNWLSRSVFCKESFLKTTSTQPRSVHSSV